MPSFAKSLSLHRDIQPFAEYAVTPFVGVWIDTQMQQSNLVRSQVTPFVGVWIETEQKLEHRQWRLVTPFVGVWIETQETQETQETEESHPSWVCGLKQNAMRLLDLLG